MMPLCTATTFMSSLQWGWALISLGSPWVAQRVWPMPQLPGRARPPFIFSERTFSRPLAFTSCTGASPSRVATPAES